MNIQLQTMCYQKMAFVFFSNSHTETINWKLLMWILFLSELIHFSNRSPSSIELSSRLSMIEFKFGARSHTFHKEWIFNCDNTYGIERFDFGLIWKVTMSTVIDRCRWTNDTALFIAKRIRKQAFISARQTTYGIYFILFFSAKFIFFRRNWKCRTVITMRCWPSLPLWLVSLKIGPNFIWNQPITTYRQVYESCVGLS